MAAAGAPPTSPATTRASCWPVSAASATRSSGCCAARATCPPCSSAIADHVDFIRRLGMKCYYGDATRLQLLRAAGAEEAKILVIAVDDEEQCMSIIETCKKHFPHLKLLARACSRNHAYELHDAGVRYFIEQLGSSLDCRDRDAGGARAPDRSREGCRAPFQGTRTRGPSAGGGAPPQRRELCGDGAAEPRRPRLAPPQRPPAGGRPR